MSSVFRPAARLCNSYMLTSKGCIIILIVLSGVYVDLNRPPEGVWRSISSTKGGMTIYIVLKGRYDNS